MKASDKVISRMKQLYARVLSGVNAGTSHELDTAQRLLDALLDKYGMQLDDIRIKEGTDSTSASINTLVYTPESTLLNKRSEAWLGVMYGSLENYFGCRIVMHSGKHSATFMGENDLSEVSAMANMVMTRLEACHKLAKVFCSKLSSFDYCLGFMYGANVALIEKKTKNNEGKEETDDKEALAIISHALATIDKGLNDANIEKEQKEQKIKDRNAFMLGYLDGSKLFEKLLTA